MNLYTKIAVAGILAGVVSMPLQATPADCTGPTDLPQTGMTSAFCHNGRMGFAATEYAAISTASNLPRLRAIDFAKRQAEQKARASLARFLNDSTMIRTTIQSDTNLDSSEKQAYLSLYSDTQIETTRAKLAAGVAVLAVEERDGAVFVTVATSPDMKDLASSISNYRPGSGQDAEQPVTETKELVSPSPYTVVPERNSSW